MAKKTNIYVDNKEFLELLKDYRVGLVKAEEQHTAPPKISNEIGLVFIKIATNMAKRPNFNGYPFKEDMIGDAILNQLQAVKNFDPTKGVNPFGYFSRVVYWCFLRRILDEKAELAGKAKMMFDTATYEDDGEHYISKDETYLWYHQ